MLQVDMMFMPENVPTQSRQLVHPWPMISVNAPAERRIVGYTPCFRGSRGAALAALRWYVYRAHLALAWRAHLPGRSEQDSLVKISSAT